MMASSSSIREYLMSFRKPLLFYLILLLFTSSFLVSHVLAQSTTTQPQTKKFLSNRRSMSAVEIAEQDEPQPPPPPKKKTNLSSKNQTKPIKPTTNKYSTNSTKLIKTTSKSSASSTKPSNTTTTTTTTTLSKSLFKKLNSTSKASNSTKLNTVTSKKSSDLSKLNTPKTKTQPIITKQQSPPKNPSKKTQSTPTKTHIPIQPNWMDIEDDEDFISEVRDLPSKFHETLLPDLETLSITSKAYMSRANLEISEGFRPLVGKQYAPAIASVLSCVFILLPLLLVSLLFNRIKAYFPLQTFLIFVQIYLSIYFFILSLASLITGLEPLKFFYVTSQSSYVCLQVLQTLGYVLYLVLLLINLVVVFSTETGFGSKILGLAQTIVGCAVGLHYYVAVFHRAVLHQPPKTNWKVHWIYATCFLIICVFTRAERRKKGYMELDGEEAKKS